MYNTTAFLYEDTAAFEAQAESCALILERLSQCGISALGVLGDLGCGTGLMAIQLAKRGWRIEGIELADAMLDVARHKLSGESPEVQKRVTFTQGDITRFEPPAVPWDAAICLHNTINHLIEPSQVEGFIRSTFNALKPGGVLILDSDTHETFEGFFHHEPTVVFDDGTHRLTRSCTFNAETGRAHHLAVVERYEEGGFETVSTEPMDLQYHAERELFAAFQFAGFQPAAVEPYNPNPELYSAGFTPKLLWLLRKPV